jgi:hypothetical protein
VNILDAINDPKVFGEHFRSGTWDAWLAFLAALFALPMTDEQLAVYRKHTQRDLPPAQPPTEAWLVVGRRGGKSFVLATIAVFLACFKNWQPLLGPGEYGTIMVIAEDRKQARAIMRFIGGLLRGAPMLRRTIVNETAESFTLKNRIQIEVHAASFRSTRGYTIIAALLDEIAIWPTDELSAEPDVEVINSIRPGMATIPGAMLLCASSPHAMRGALWEAWRQYFGHADEDVLVWQATTNEMNPTVSQAWIDQQLARDSVRGAADYLAQFRSDVVGFIPRDAVMACVVPGLRELPPDRRLRYHAFCDPSGGSSDSMTLCIAHNDITRRTVILDALREVKPPFSPEAVVAEFCALLKSYNVYSATGDHYAKLWPVEVFRRHGVRYEQHAQPKSDLYAALLPLINSRRIDFFDLPSLIGQTCALERSTRHGSAEKIDHPPHGHDDVINAVAGVASLCTRATGYSLETLRRATAWGDEDEDKISEPSPIPSGMTVEQYERITRPVSLTSEWIPEHVAEGFVRARLDALRRNGGRT